MPHSTERQESPAGELDASNADAALLDALVREHRDAAVAYATRILGDAHLAEDAVQRALLQILVRVRGGDDQLLAVNPRAVVLRGTRWAALKLAERHSSRGEAERRAAGEALGSADDHDWDRLEARMLVEDILPSLPEHYRDVLRLRYLEGQPDIRAAEDLAVTLKAYRRRLDRALAVARVAAVRIGVTSLGAAVLGALRRARGRAQRLLLASDHAAWSPFGAGSTVRTSVGHVALALALVGLVVGAPAVHHAVDGSGVPHAAGGASTPRGAIAATGALAVAPSGTHAIVAAASRLRAPVAGPPSSAAGESLADTEVVAVVPAPHATDNHTVVADGYGKRCACHVFLQTTDGGATWTSYPAAGDGILLPPDYPRDPRVFLHGSSQLYGLGFCVEQRISAGSCSPMLGVPYGSAAVLDPAFDAGHPLIYVSTSAGVLAYDVATGHSTPLELNSSSNLAGAAMAATGGSGPYAVYLLIRGTPAPQGMTVTSEPATAAAPWVGAPHLVACRSDGSCISLADLPADVYQLYGDRDDPAGRTVVGLGAGRLVVTSDAGLTQRSVALPQAGVLGMQVTGSGAQLQVTAAMVTGAWQHVLLGTWQQATGWQLRSMDTIAPSMAMPYQVPLGGGRVIVGVGGSADGIYCTTDSGLHWDRFCPPAG